MIVTAGTADVTTYFHLRLAADGTDATGLTITNIDLQYVRSGAAPVAKVDATALAAADSAHGDNQAFEIDATDQPGVYRVDWPDAAFVAGVREVILTVKCATVFTESLRVQIVSATRGLAGTALPDAAADAAGGLPISDAGGLDLDARLDAAVSSRLAPTVAARTLDVTATGAAGVDWGNVENPTTVVGLSGTTVKTATDVETDTQDIQTKIGTPAGASVSADIAAIEAQTDDIGVAGAGLTAVPWNAAWDAEVQSEVDDALVAQRLDELLNADSDIDGAAPPTVGSVVHEMLSKTAGAFTFDQTTDSLEALADAAAPSAATVADAVWDEAIAGHLGAGSTGAALNAAGSAGDPWTTPLPGAYGAGTAGKIVGDNVNATISSRSSHSAADVWAVATRTLTAFDASFKTGYALSAAGVQAIWDALTSALTTVGSIGKLLVDNINATISSRSSHSATDVWAAGIRTLTAGTNIVLAKGVGVTGFNDVSAAQVNAEADTALADYDAPTKAELDAAVAPLSTAAALTTVGSNVTAIKAKTDNLPEGVKKNQALASFEFLMVDSTDHVTGKTGLTVTATRSIDGAAFAACANSPTEVASGIYAIDLAAADLNGTVITLKFTAATADDTLVTLKTTT